ncbi:MAG: carbohydrate ABC transporter permease [Spirochaetales bacterium]|nr:carbohydrate ABC transporter permease [Spirochaetales bacterium]
MSERMEPIAKTKMTKIAKIATAKSGGSVFLRYDKTFGAIAFNTINTILLILIAAVMLYPFIYIISESISSLDAVARGAVKLWPVGFSPEAYRRVLTNNLFFTAYKNTIIYSVSGVALHLFCLVIVAYPLSLKNFYGRNVIMAFFAFTMFFSGGLIPTYLLVRSLGMLNSIWAIIVPGAFDVFYIVIMRTNFENIPMSLRESAYIDGASHFRILFSIVLPLSMPIIATLFLFIIVSFWNEFFTPLLYITDLKKQPLQVMLRQLIVKNSFGDFVSFQESYMVKPMPPPGLQKAIKDAAIIVSTGPILLVYPFIQRYFVKGIMIGSIKG